MTEMELREVPAMPLLPRLVSPEELRNALGDERVRVFDATVFLRRAADGARAASRAASTCRGTAWLTRRRISSPAEVRESQPVRYPGQA